MSDLLGIGSSGLRAYRAALAAVSENIVNADNRDYSRRRVDVVEAMAVARPSPLYAANRDFQGADVGGIRRSGDMLADQGLRFALAASGTANARAAWLEQAEVALGDDAAGVGQRLGVFFASAQELAGAPDSAALRATMLSALDDVARAFNAAGNRLTEVQAQLGDALAVSAGDASRHLATLAGLNRDLLGTIDGSAAQAQMFDQRDAALFKLSAILPVTVSLGTKGDVALTLADGTSLVNGVNAAAVTIGGSMDAPALLVNGTAAALPPEGALAGQAGSAAALSAHRVSLDNVAGNFAAALNGWQAMGTAAGGSAGAPLLSGSDATSLTLVATDPAAIAAARGGVANGNLTALAALRDPAGAEAGWQSLVNVLALQGESSRIAQDAADTQVGHARVRRDAASAVDLDAEAAEMVRLQQAYEAAARVIQVARETINAILAIF
ncbi:MAG: hypothetical protein RLZZ58_1479 [Pseudomonadota bacterium]